MKHKIKYIIWFILIFIVLTTIYKYLFLYKIKNIKQNKAIFNIISKTNINIENNLDLSGKTQNYKNIENINIIGKGFFINTSGEFLTAKHLFTNKNSIFYIKIDNTKYNFKIIKNYKNKDIVLGKIKKYKNKYFLNINKSQHDYLIYENLKIFTYKNNKIINGQVTGISEKIKNLNLNNLIKTNIKLFSGDSGSPLLNKRNIVIGIFIAIKKGKNISYAQYIK